MRAVPLVLVVLVLSAACLPSKPSGRSSGAEWRPPVPSRAALLDLGGRADDARAAELAGGAAALGAVFAGDALDQLKAAVVHLRRLEQLVQRRLGARTLVHWSAAAGVAAGVLAISGWSRLISRGVAAPWSPFLEQWAFRVAWRGGWRIVQAAEVPPEAWWR